MTSIAKIELDSWSDFQKDLHRANMYEDPDTKETKYEEIGSIFHNEFQKCTWHTKTLCKVPCSIQDDNLFIYRANTNFHYLLSTYMIQFLPHVWIKEEYQDQYQICWCHNPAINTIVSARMEIDQDPINQFDHVYLDQYYEFFTKPGYREHQDVCMGNVPMLENWTAELKPYKTSLEHPWYYSQDPKLAFPLLFCSKDTDVSHVYKMRIFPSEILRMRKRITTRDGKNVWVEMKELDFDVLEGITSKTTFKKPEMWAHYAYITKNELSYRKDCMNTRIPNSDIHRDDKSLPEDYGYVFYINDVVYYDQTNTQTYNKSVKIDIPCDKPCNALFWCAENVNASEHRNYSNYTTNVNDIRKGWNPIDWVTMKYSKEDRFTELDSIHFDRIQPYSMFSPPCSAGYNVYSLAFRCYNIDAEIGICFYNLQASMIFKLKNTNPFEIPKPVKTKDVDISDLDDISSVDKEQTPIPSVTSYIDDEDQLATSQPQFTLHVRLLITKKLVVRKIDNDKFKFEIL